MTEVVEINEAGSHPRSIFDVDLLDSEERDYFRFVDAAMERTESRIFSNSKPAHAVYIIFKFLSTAKQHVQICTGHLMRTFDGVRAYDDPKLAAAASDFLDRGGLLDIVIRDEPDLEPQQQIEDHPLFASIQPTDLQGLGRLRVYRHSRERNASDDPIENHFIIKDGEDVRLEVDPETAEAYVQLKNPEIGEILTNWFKEIASGSELVHSR